MRSLKSGLFAIAFAGLIGSAAVIGCSADGGGTDLGQGNDPTTMPPDPNAGTSGSVVPPKTPDGTPDMDAGTVTKKDAAPKAEAGVDAGPPPPVEGTACSTPNAKASKSCGMCGKAETLCLAEDGGAQWGPYGQCLNEVVGGCMPGATRACGNCGTQTCSAYCGWGSCTGQPAGACPAGSVDYTTASCSTPNTYRSRTCSATCAWDNYSATCAEANTPNKMTVPALNGVVSAQWTVAGSTKRPSTCPDTIDASSEVVPYVAVQVTNPTAKTAVVSLYQSKSVTGKPDFDMVLWRYNGTGLPMSDAALGACVGSVADSCTGTAASNPCGNTGSNYDFAGMDNVSIPAGGSILVYSGAYGSFTTIGDGTFTLNIKTTALN